MRRGFAPDFVNNKKGCTRLAAASDKVYQLLAHGRWSSPRTPASSTSKTGRHDIAEILLKVALTHQKSKSIRIQKVPLLLLFCVRDLKMASWRNNNDHNTRDQFLIASSEQFSARCLFA